MSMDKIVEEKIIQTVNDVIKNHGPVRDELVPILLDLNSSFGYLPQAALEQVSVQLQMPKSEIYSVASFYSMLSMKPRGRHVIQFCESAPCHIAGGREVWDTLKDTLNLTPEETSSDGKWTLTTTSCLGLCADGPVIIIDEDRYENVEPSQVAEILARYK